MDKLFIPQKIRVGFQHRKDTFTGKLGFVTYIDDKGILRQEKSWEGWRNSKIAFVEFDNAPQSNFVINKDVTRSGHWSTHSKVRIYDHRDFEFEIELSNMIYILMHSDVSKRDIIENCVFAWDGKKLVLLPVNSEVYQASLEHTRKEKLTAFSFKDLVVGATYFTKNYDNAIYMGRFDWAVDNYQKGYKAIGKKHIFKIEKKYFPPYISLDAKDIYEQINDDIVSNYSDLMEALEKIPNMKKAGAFSVKKGFDNTGFKQTSYECYRVSVSDNGMFNIKIVQFIYDDKNPSYTLKNDYYYQRQLENEMYDTRIDRKNKQSVVGFFVSKGWGRLFYKNTTNELVQIS